MKGTRRVAIAWLACILAALFLQPPALARAVSADLRREKARRREMTAQEEKPAAELSDARR